jgi:hypothetical protein
MYIKNMISSRHMIANHKVIQKNCTMAQFFFQPTALAMGSFFDGSH